MGIEGELPELRDELAAELHQEDDEDAPTWTEWDSASLAEEEDHEEEAEEELIEDDDDSRGFGTLGAVFGLRRRSAW